ncbi:hypothetical protein [Brevibacterium jeotgali]|uniref:Lipoprotein n=1 Tax=Brevibacterium jeotgali TaxID=1262550 RepID=A0A2H1L2K3_9MICO|nr:hypothetical protein [Brevibacterium jeotgali]TWC02335.1 hypothetical protein FB108_1009 [Brevibacterium jeotgali]SMY11128.1 hypothetical protein BJEO58_00710 [Brevibacterium jeotgali]
MNKLLIAPIAAVALAISGCGAAPASDQTTNTSESKNPVAEAQAPAPSSAVDEYFEAFSVDTPSQFEYAASLAAPGSIAEEYASYSALVSSALSDNGYSSSPSNFSPRESDVELCDQDDVCTIFADFEFDDEKLASYTVNGLSIDDRLLPGRGETTKFEDVAGFEILGSYQATSNDALQAVIRFEAYERPISASYVITYRDPTGRQVDEEFSLKPSLVASDSNQLGYAIIPNAEVGGEFLLKFATDDDEPLVVETVTVPTK